MIVLGIAAAIIAAVCVLACLIGDDRPINTEPEQEPHTGHDADLCMVRSPLACKRQAVRDLNGWRLCLDHYDRSSAGRSA